ncbi:synaptic plasticity regulator PANTS [Pelobates fuscus]|uniref:synaptic plasticity regulator PANTS n=1 Tax=Pelobates fuscus TaxID=191477 RepID=UPI002FE42C5A
MADRDTWRTPRDCSDYWIEWKHCRSLSNRFHNYYTHGIAPECQHWKIDYKSCKDWEATANNEAKEALRQSENSRLNEKQSYLPVWRLRKKPPADWYLPLDRDKFKQ